MDGKVEGHAFLDGPGPAVSVLEPYLHTHHYHAGQVLWNEGDVTGRLVLLRKGRVKVLHAMADGSSVLLYVFSEGDLFGFLPFIDGGPYPATAVAVDEVEARVMSRSALRTAIAKDPEVAFVLLGALGARLRQAFVRIGDHAQRNAVVRVAAAVVLLLPEPRASSPTLVDIPGPLHDFAADVGMTPETFSRALTQLVDKGLLHRLASPRIQVLDVVGLKRIASGPFD